MSGRSSGLSKNLKSMWPGVLALGLALFVACARSSSDARRVSEAVDSLRSGDVIQELEAAARNEAARKDLFGGAEPEWARLPEISKNKRFCANVPAFLSAELDLRSQEQTQVHLLSLMGCLRGLLKPARDLEALFHWLRIFSTPSLSAVPQDISGFLLAHPYSLRDRVSMTENESPRLRNSFSDTELDVLARVARDRKAALFQAEAAVLHELGFHLPLLEKFSEDIDRYAALMALLRSARENPEDAGSAAFEALAEALSFSSIRVPRRAEFPVSLLHPYAVEALIPSEGREWMALRGNRENPFARVLQAARMLGAGAVQRNKIMEEYRTWRAKDNPVQPVNGSAAENAARVAFLDTGIDFVSYPELGVFLGASYDFSDQDQNPWLPSHRADFRHGTGTVATLLTLLSAKAPEVLLERKVDVSVWKTQSLRQLLSGSDADDTSWESGLPDLTAIASQAVRDQTSGVGLRIVSVSAAIPLFATLDTLARTDLAPGIAQKAPWLWVMAAGNSAVNVDNPGMSVCLSDFPKETRDDSKILCIGALARTPGGPQVASYSNFGSRVDLYTFDSYTGLCPAGTSCSTPAITAAAAILAAKYPALSAAQIKKVLVKAGETRKLRVAPLEGALGGAEITREVRVFDPSVMMERALEEASREIEKTPKL